MFCTRGDYNIYQMATLFTCSVHEETTTFIRWPHCSRVLYTRRLQHLSDGHTVHVFCTRGDYSTNHIAALFTYSVHCIFSRKERVARKETCVALTYVLVCIRTCLSLWFQWGLTQAPCEGSTLEQSVPSWSMPQPPGPPLQMPTGASWKESKMSHDQPLLVHWKQRSPRRRREQTWSPGTPKNI